MKKLLLYVLFLISNSLQGYSQEIMNVTGPDTNEAIQQITLPGINDILGFQTLNRNTGNYVSLQQSGNQNTTNINQQSGVSTEMTNQAYTAQSGNSNELTLGQIGSGNLLLGFQLGYMATLTGSQQTNQTVIPTGYVFTAGSLIADNAPEGEGNKMTITQSGNNNGVMAVQQGSYNTLSAEQTGNNNYLLALQKGSNNTIDDYKQANKSDQVLYDRIVQTGDYLTLKSDIASSSGAGNTFLQTGTHLSLEMNSDLINSPGGIQINQTGKDMKVVINQSYFSFPLK